MASMNIVYLSGNLTRDPELRYVGAGTPLATFAIATTRRYRHNDESKEETSFVDIKCWGALAERAGRRIVEGLPSRVARTPRARALAGGRWQREIKDCRRRGSSGCRRTAERSTRMIPFPSPRKPGNPKTPCQNCDHAYRQGRARRRPSPQPKAVDRRDNPSGTTPD